MIRQDKLAFRPRISLPSRNGNIHTERATRNDEDFSRIPTLVIDITSDSEDEYNSCEDLDSDVVGGGAGKVFSKKATTACADTPFSRPKPTRLSLKLLFLPAP